MSSALDAVFTQAVLATQAAGHRRSFRVVTGPDAGRAFDGTLAVRDVVDLDAPVGKDSREQVILEVLAPGPRLSSQNTFVELPEATLWNVVTREDNPADVEVRYRVVKVVAGKDT